MKLKIKMKHRYRSSKFCVAMILFTTRAGTGARPGPARRPRPEQKLAINKPNTQYHPGSNLGKTRELFVRLDRARKTDGYTEAQVKLEDF